MINALIIAQMATMLPTEDVNQKPVKLVSIFLETIVLNAQDILILNNAITLVLLVLSLLVKIVLQSVLLKMKFIPMVAVFVLMDYLELMEDALDAKKEQNMIIVQKLVYQFAHLIQSIYLKLTHANAMMDITCSMEDALNVHLIKCLITPGAVIYGAQIIMYSMEKIVFVHMDSIYYQLAVENAEKTKFIIQYKKPAVPDVQFIKFGKLILVDAQQDTIELTEYVNLVE